MVPFLTGEVPTDGIAVTFIPIDTPGEIFRRTRDGDFEAGEVASSELLRWVSAGDDTLIGIPVFPVRVFRHGMIWVHRDGGIATPKDSRGSGSGFRNGRRRPHCGSEGCLRTSTAST